MYLGFGRLEVGRNKRRKLMAEGFHVSSAVPFNGFAIKFRGLIAGACYSLLHHESIVRLFHKLSQLQDRN